MTNTELVSEHHKWIFQSLRLAYLAHGSNDEKLRDVLNSSGAEKLLDNWLTAAELFESNAELLTVVLERSAALRGNRTD